VRKRRTPDDARREPHPMGYCLIELLWRVLKRDPIKQHFFRRALVRKALIGWIEVLSELEHSDRLVVV
jgi:hypothetical protein